MSHVLMNLLGGDERMSNMHVTLLKEHGERMPNVYANLQRRGGVE